MIVVTSENIAGKRIVKTLGLVRGNTVRARHVGKDIMAGLRNIVGGEVHEYAKLVAESREQSLDRMTREAAELGANAVVATRFTTSVLMGTGLFRTAETAGAHIAGGARKVVISAPAKGGVEKTVVYGVNDDILTADDQIISNASCTTNCSGAAGVRRCNDS